jgi:tetrahydromethanopterin S-methyltransferase subunit H
MTFQIKGEVRKNIYTLFFLQRDIIKAERKELYDKYEAENLDKIENLALEVKKDNMEDHVIYDRKKTFNINRGIEEENHLDLNYHS